MLRSGTSASLGGEPSGGESGGLGDVGGGAWRALGKGVGRCHLGGRSAHKVQRRSASWSSSLTSVGVGAAPSPPPPRWAQQAGAVVSAVRSSFQSPLRLEEPASGLTS